MKTEKKQFCRIIKEWGGFPVGHELWIGDPKAGHLQVAGFVEFLPSPKKEKARPKVETATAKPKAERAEVTPIVVPGPPAEKADVEPEKVADKKPKKDKNKGRRS